MISAFIDTNVWIYASDKGAGQKSIDASELIRRTLAEDTIVLSHQVLREYLAVVLRPGKGRIPATENDAWNFARVYILPFCTVIEDASLHETAHRLRTDHRLSVYDSFMVAAAIQGRCQILYTEDLHHGQTIEGVEIRNPFLSV